MVNGEGVTDNISFMHKTLQEYFVARYVASHAEQKHPLDLTADVVVLQCFREGFAEDAFAVKPCTECPFVPTRVVSEMQAARETSIGTAVGIENDVRDAILIVGKHNPIIAKAINEATAPAAAAEGGGTEGCAARGTSIDGSGGVGARAEIVAALLRHILRSRGSNDKKSDRLAASSITLLNVAGVSLAGFILFDFAKISENSNCLEEEKTGQF